MLNRLKGIVYDLALLLAKSGKRKNVHRKALIVKPDEIGDYILWRKFIPELVGSELLKDHEVHFCGNIAWKSLFAIDDNTYFKKVWWLRKNDFKKKIYYRHNFLRAIFLEGYDIVINPVYSRAKRVDDAIVSAASANQRIGQERNNENVKAYEMNDDKGLYTRLFNSPPAPLFEFLRNRLFAEFITGRPSVISNTSINSENIPALETSQLPEKYFVVFPGSGSKNRIWPAENFVRVSDHLYEQFKWTAIICGGPGDQDYANAFIEEYTFPVINLTSKTSLPQLLLVLQNAQCLVSIDTGAVHLAAAVGCTVFGVFNGSQYGRFAPYPVAINKNFFPVYPDEVESDLEQGPAALEKYEYVVGIPYTRVSSQKVITVMNKYLN